MKLSDEYPPTSTVVASGAVAIVAPIVPYEKRMDRDPGWALTEGSLFFEDKGAVQEALRRIATKLHELGIDYAVAGGLALFKHGVRRYTENVDILVTRESLKAIHRQLDGRGYVRPFEKSKNLRDIAYGVEIAFLVMGEYPGDRQPKPVPFPDPRAVTVAIDGIRYVNLPTLIELKVAAGMSNSSRTQDLVDAQELIATLKLPAGFVVNLNPFVHDKFTDLWQAAQPVIKPYALIARNKPSAVESIPRGDGPFPLEISTDALQVMLADGVVIDSTKNLGENLLYLVTNDPTVAIKYGMQDESEFLV